MTAVNTDIGTSDLADVKVRRLLFVFVKLTLVLSAVTSVQGGHILEQFNYELFPFHQLLTTTLLFFLHMVADLA